MLKEFYSSMPELSLLAHLHSTMTHLLTVFFHDKIIHSDLQNRKDKMPIFIADFASLQVFTEWQAKHSKVGG